MRKILLGLLLLPILAFAQAYPLIKWNAQTYYSVTTSSTAAVALNPSRKSLIMKNTGTLPVDIGIGSNAAVVGSGIRLNPGDVWEMDKNTFTTQNINAITTTGGSTLQIQEGQ